MMIKPDHEPTNFIFVVKKIATEEEIDYDDHTKYDVID